MSNREQIEFWNGNAGDRWVRNQVRLDRVLGPFGSAALERLAPAAGEGILDVGCGAGDTLLQVAARVGSSGHAVGIDPSRPLLELARQRTAQLPNVRLVEGDAAAHVFSERFEGVFSLFGVMFFAEPEAAFSALRLALLAEGRLGFVCWQALEENPWSYLPLVVARAALGDVPTAVAPNAPGPFSLANPARVTGILRAAGYHRIEVEGFRTLVTLTDQGLDDAVDLSFQLGPVARLLAQRPEPQHRLVRERIAERLGPLLRDGVLQLEGAAWLVTALA